MGRASEADAAEGLLANPVWHALGSGDAHAAESGRGARRYRPDVSVFYAVDRLDADGWAGLADLAGTDNRVVLIREAVEPIPRGWARFAGVVAHQMVLTDWTSPSDPKLDRVSAPIRLLDAGDVAQMIDLVRLTRPGPFRAGTIELGPFWGVVEDGQLVAMAGERMHLTGFTEISAVCTHPDVRRRGLGAALTRHVATAIADRGDIPFLHVADGNEHARRIYELLGFVTRRVVKVEILRSPAST